jgi:Xaa-Pro aminopeptidase
MPCARPAAPPSSIPSSDPHLSEYLPERWQARQWASGFTGSMATLVVTTERAALFADSRYWVQAESQLAGSGIELVRIPTPPGAQHVDWLCANVGRGTTVAVDGDVIGLAAARQLRETLAKCDITLRSDLDVVAAAWPDRPTMPAAKVYEHTGAEAPHARAGQARASARGDARRRRDAPPDLDRRRHRLAVEPARRRRRLQPGLPGPPAARPSAATLYVGAGKIDSALAAALAADGVRVAPTTTSPARSRRLPAAARLLVDPRRTTLGLVERSRASAHRGDQPEHARQEQEERRRGRQRAPRHDRGRRRDVRVLRVVRGGARRPVAAHADHRADDRREARRGARAPPGYVGPSFATIAAFNANGAMPHYRATPESHATIEGDGLLLIDSGAQYLGGTTDITRMWPIGRISEAQRRDVTTVLRGTMALSRTRFPRGTPGPMLDAIARAPLWAHGLDYGHGTGHGVGYFLNVHEGPQTISRAVAEPAMAMQPGMITSIEPGVYRPGQWGVRVENLVLNVPAPQVGSEFGEFLEFETLTLCPIDARCLDASLLRADEIAWLNGYHDGSPSDWRRASTAPRSPGCACAPRRSDASGPASSGADGRRRRCIHRLWCGSSPDSRLRRNALSGAAKACLESAPTNPAAPQEHAMISRLTAPPPSSPSSPPPASASPPKRSSGPSRSRPPARSTPTITLPTVVITGKRISRA